LHTLGALLINAKLLFLPTQEKIEKRETMENKERDEQLVELFTQVKQKIQEHPEHFEMCNYDAQCGTVHCIGGWANFLLRKQGIRIDWENHFKLSFFNSKKLEFVSDWPDSFKHSLLPKYNLGEKAKYDNWEFDRIFSPEQRQEIACARIDWFLTNKEWELKPFSVVE